MPLEVDKLTPKSPMQTIREAISKTIAYLIKNEGKTQKQAAGEAYGIAREKTGKDLGEGRQR